MILEPKRRVFRFVLGAVGVQAYWCLIEATIYTSGRTDKRSGTFLVRRQLTSRYSAISRISESRRAHPRTWTRQGPWLGHIVPLEKQYEAYRTRRTPSFSGYTSSWSRRSCSRTLARREEAERNTSRCLIRKFPVQPVGSDGECH
jgi:hypothetical protein